MLQTLTKPLLQTEAGNRKQMVVGGISLITAILIQRAVGNASQAMEIISGITSMEKAI